MRNIKEKIGEKREGTEIDTAATGEVRNMITYANKKRKVAI